jgi:hypothetical protein
VRRCKITKFATKLDSTYLFRLLGKKDALSVHSIHKQIVGDLGNKAYMYNRDLELFETLLEGQGRIIGAFYGEQLIGYSAFTRPGFSLGNHARSLNKFGIKQKKISEGSGSGVLPPHRRRGVFHELMRHRFQMMDKENCLFSTTVVALENITALQAALGENCMLASTLSDEDGQNYMLFRALNGRRDLRSPPLELSKLQDTQKNLRLLKAGEFVGVNDFSGDGQSLKFCGLSSSWLQSADVRTSSVEPLLNRYCQRNLR